MISLAAALCVVILQPQREKKKNKLIRGFRKINTMSIKYHFIASYTGDVQQ